MINVLFVNSCVRGKFSRTYTIAKQYIDIIKKSDKINIQEVNICKDRIKCITQQDFSRENGELLLSESNILATQFAEADSIIIAAPFWEFLFPANLICYIEKISVVGVTFKYTQNGSKGLCKAKNMRLFYSSGDFLKDEDKIGEAYLKRLCKLYSIQDFHAISANGLDIDGQNITKIINEAKVEAKEIAESDIDAYNIK